MSDRHQELLRQRAIVQEHLAWLDREIAQISPNKTQPTPVSLARPAPPAPLPSAPSGHLAGQAADLTRHAAASRPTSENSSVPSAAEAILEEYRVAPDTLKTDIRKGCLLYFVGALSLVALVVSVLYFLISKR